MIVATVVGGCDEGADQGVVGQGPTARKLDHVGNVALYEVAIDGEIRDVQVIEPLGTLAFRILDGDGLVVEVIDRGDGPQFRSPGALYTADELVCDAASESIAEFVLDGGLTTDGDDAEFRRRIDPISCPFDCRAGCDYDPWCTEWCINMACFG